MKKLQIKPELLTEEQRDKLEAYQAQQKQLTVLQDIADMTQDMVMESDKSKKFTQKAVEDMGALLMDMRESLGALKDKKDPEAPDYAKPVVEAVAKLEKALAAIEVKPSVTVSPPDVRVPAVDVSPITKILKEEMPKAFERAIKLIPRVELPETDNSELLQAWEGISEQLVSIENATRMKPLPGSMTISNLDEVTNALPSNAPKKTLIDKTTTTDVIYIGEAAIGTATSAPTWFITKVDKSSSPISITFAAEGDSTATWDDRATDEDYT